MGCCQEHNAESSASAPQFAKAQAQFVVPALQASGYQAVQEQHMGVSNLKAFAISILLHSNDEFSLEACPALLGNIPLAK